MNNGILQVTFSKPQGRVIGIKFNGIDNLLDYAHKENNLGGYTHLISTKNSIYNPKLCSVNFNVICLFCVAYVMKLKTVLKCNEELANGQLDAYIC